MTTAPSFLAANLDGMKSIREVQAAANATSAAQVARDYGYLPSTINHLLWVGTFYDDPQVAAAAADAELSLSIAEILAKACNKAPEGRDITANMLELITLVKGKEASIAKTLAADCVRQWNEEAAPEDKADIAHMHPDVEPDGKRRLVARLSDDVATEVDRVLHHSAKAIMSSAQVPYPVAYAKALVAKVLGNDSDATQEPLFSPMFLIGTDCRYHADGRIATAAGGLVNLASVVNKPLKNTGYAAVLAKDENDIPQVAALVAVEREDQGSRFANNYQRLIAVLETLVCANPGCNRSAAKCQFHHIHPWHLGGKTEQKNLVALCPTDNGRNDDDPDKPPKNGRVERDPTTGRAGWRKSRVSPLEFNEHPLVKKGTRAYGDLVYHFEAT